MARLQRRQAAHGSRPHQLQLGRRDPEDELLDRGSDLDRVLPTCIEFQPPEAIRLEPRKASDKPVGIRRADLKADPPPGSTDSVTGGGDARRDSASQPAREKAKAIADDVSDAVTGGDPESSADRIANHGHEREAEPVAATNDICLPSSGSGCPGDPLCSQAVTFADLAQRESPNENCAGGAADELCATAIHVEKAHQADYSNSGCVADTKAEAFGKPDVSSDDHALI
jgi:hypothetical protein